MSNKRFCNSACRTACASLVLLSTDVDADYSLYDGRYASLSAGIQVQTASLGEINNRAGDPNNGLLSDIYWELTVEPKIKGAIHLPEGSRIYSGFSMIYSAMLGHDPSFITSKATYPDYKDWMMSEEMYIGWRSGNWFQEWGENAVDLSAGAQDYILGTGLLLANGTDDGGYRGSYWIGSRTAFINTLIARINIHGLKLEGFYLENHPRVAEARKRYTGMNIEYNYRDIANVAFSYIHDDDFSGEITAEIDAYDARIEFEPMPSLLPDLSIKTEYVGQFINKKTDPDPQNPDLYYYGALGSKVVSGGFGEIEYRFVDWPWQPALSYRYAVTESGFDFMNFGFKTWGTWFQGEINGEFIFDNTNLITQLTRLVIMPTESLTVNLIYFNFQFDKPKTYGVTSSNYGNEVDIVADLSVNDHLDLAAGIETFIPDAGGQQFFNGGNRMWIQGMLYASFKF